MERKDIRKSNKTLNILHIAATDKENLSSKIISKKNETGKVYKDIAGKRFKKNNDMGKTELKAKVNISEPNNDVSKLPGSILESDLTIDNPSENYWKNLAESRSKALKSALKENVDLHNKVNELEYENERLKAMLDEAKALVEILTEMIQENQLEDEVNGNENISV